MPGILSRSLSYSASISSVTDVRKQTSVSQKLY